jgi:hypothetical protein
LKLLHAASDRVEYRDECRMELQAVTLQVAGSSPVGSPTNKGPVAQRIEQGFHHLSSSRTKFEMHGECRGNYIAVTEKCFFCFLVAMT